MKLFNYFWLVFFLVAACYLLYPVPGFPNSPAGSLISTEPGDTESIYRRAFYTNLTRAEIIDYYKFQWRRPFVRLILPPEDAATVIRDQTRSSWLEELVHPGKNSLYVNGFYPTKPTEQFNYEEQLWNGKITVRLVPSKLPTRLTVLALVALSSFILVKEYVKI